MTNWIDILGFSNAQPVGLLAYLVVAALLFTFGLCSCLMRQNAIGILIGIELILNAAVINFMAFWRFVVANTQEPVGPIASVFIFILAACEAAIALAILLNLYFNFGTVEVDSVHEMER